MKVNAFVSQAHYVNHWAPVWLALPVRARGTVFVPPRVEMDFAMCRWGIDAQMGIPDPSPLTLILSGNDLGHFEQPILLDHGAGQTYIGVDNPSWAGGKGRDRVVRFLVPNEMAAAANRATYPHISNVVVGSPHVEWLRTLPYTPKYATCFSRHWGPGIVPEMNSAWWEYEDAIHDYWDAHPGDVALHAHPRVLWEQRRLANIWSVPLLPTFEQVVTECTTYVCDSSSTIVEWAALGRPVVMLDAKRWRRDVKHGGRFWRWAEHFPSVSKPDDLARVVAGAEPCGATLVEETFPVIEGAAKLAAEAIETCL